MGSLADRRDDVTEADIRREIERLAEEDDGIKGEVARQYLARRED